MGAAMLAGVGVGLFRDLAEASVMRGEVEQFAGTLDDNERRARLAGWTVAVRRVVDA